MMEAAESASCSASESIVTEYEKQRALGVNRTCRIGMKEFAPKAFNLLTSAELGAFVLGCNRPKTARS
ncbi:hypothetical protein [Paenibacillus sp. GCM10012303]|jgi:hypothetical protein|uniref:hypothetical protein n=1 Tax=Paenibacillus sp. GCM10012303 TaxID=3317340 RepID=UPI003610FD63